MVMTSIQAMYVTNKNDEKAHGQCKFRTALITACLVVMCVSALSIGLYFGLRRNQAVVENHVFIQEVHGDVISADLTVTQDEEYFNFENAAVIYDFSTGLTVYKSKVADEYSEGCLVESFLMNETKTPTDVKSLIQKDQVLGQTEFEQFRVTDIWLNEEALGPLSRDLCADEEINFIEQTVGDDAGSKKDADVDDAEVTDYGALFPQLIRRRVRRGWGVRVSVRIRIRIN